MGAIAHLGAEHHLVVAAQSPAQSAAHPGLHEHGHPLVIPAWRVVARVRQVAISDGDRVVGNGGDLAQEKPPEPSILSRRLVVGHRVHELMIHQQNHAVVGQRGLEDVIRRSNADIQEVARQCGAAAVHTVGEILEQDHNLLFALVMEQLPMKRESVLETPNQVRYQIGVSGTVVDQLDVACLHGAHTLADGDAHTSGQKHRNCYDRRPDPHG